MAVAAQQRPDLLITVDNGVSSHAGVLAAQALGMKVLITDHHLPGPTLPAADALVNPNQPGDAFPSKHLAGVGVIFHVLMAVSYTHLDVYKRQIWNRSKPPTARRCYDGSGCGNWTISLSPWKPSARRLALIHI